jgi:plastocyanin
MKRAAIFFLSVCFCLLTSKTFAASDTIHFSGVSFTPSTLSVHVGDTIVWIGSFAFHIIQSETIPTGAAAWGPTTSSTTSLIYVVPKAGTYNYQCNVHVSMGMTGTFTATPLNGVTEVVSNENATLEKNYPNPFNGSTTIQYSLYHPEQVELTVFDMSGKIVKRLVGEHQNTGNYTISFNGNDLAAGTYTYQLQTGDAILSRKMVLAK